MIDARSFVKLQGLALHKGGTARVMVVARRLRGEIWELLSRPGVWSCHTDEAAPSWCGAVVIIRKRFSFTLSEFSGTYGAWKFRPAVHLSRGSWAEYRQMWRGLEYVKVNFLQ